MKNWQKFSLILLTILILIIIGTSLLVKSYLVPETIEVLVIPKLEEIIKSTISFNKLEVGFGGTIRLKNISIYDPTQHKQAILLKSRDMVLHCRLLPLLSKKIIIEEVTLHQPQINLIRDKQGNYNFTKDRTGTGEKAADKKKADDASSETALSFMVTHFNIKNGTLTFTDHTKTSSPSFQLTLKNCNIHASNISMVSSFPLKLSAEIVSTPPSFLKLKSIINLLSKEVESKVKLTPLDITPFAPYFPNLPFNLLKGYCSLNLTMTVNRSLEFFSQGLISLKDFTLSALDTPDDELSDSFIDNLRNISVESDHRLSYNPAQDTLSLEKCDAIIQKTRLSLKGKIGTCRTRPLLDLTVDTGKLSVQNILDSIPQDLIPSEDFSSSGTTEINLSIKGSPKKPEDLKMNGLLLIDKLKIWPKQTPHCNPLIDGKISLSSHEITIEHLKTTFQDSSLTLKGRINNYLKGPPLADFHLTSPSLDLDDLLSCLEEAKDKRETEEEEVEEEDQGREGIGPFNLNQAKIKADISFDSLGYKNIHLSHVKAKCLLQENVLHLETLDGMLKDGSLHLKGLTDLGVKGLDYTLQLIGNNLQLNPIINSFAPDLQETIYGTMNLSADLRGRGTTSDTFKKHLQGEGEIYMTEGKAIDLKPLKALSTFIKVDKLGTLNIEQAQGTFQIKDSLIHTKNSLKGKELELYPEGTISLDSYLDLSLEMKLSPHLSEQIANDTLTKYFKDERGWTVLALAIKGPTDEVIVMPAPSTIRNISDMFIDILLKKEDIDSAERQDKKKALENLLKGLIKKSKESREK